AAAPRLPRSIGRAGPDVEDVSAVVKRDLAIRSGATVDAQGDRPGPGPQVECRVGEQTLTPTGGHRARTRVGLRGGAPRTGRRVARRVLPRPGAGTGGGASW